MKRIFLFSIVIIIMVGSFAQKNTISITVVQPEYDNIPEEARLSLENKLDQILTHNGVVNGLSNRFVMSAKVNVLQRNIMPSNPPKISEKMDITIMIGDAIDNHIWGKTTISVSGIGVTETKTLIQAFQRISPDNEKLTQLVEQASSHILDYYMTHCNNILADAERMVRLNQYNEAITKLLSIPEGCVDCYSQAQIKATNFFQTKIDNEASLLLKQAKTEWAIHHDYQHAEKALICLLQINPHSGIINQSDILFQEIEHTLRKQEQAIAQRKLEKEKEEASRQKELEQREWDLRMQQYKDNVELRKQRIDMFKEVGIAVGKGLPESVTKIVRLW